MTAILRQVLPPTAHYRPAPRITMLGDAFYDVVTPAAFPQHVLRFRNDRWSARIGLDALRADEWEQHFARFAPLPDNLPSPLALRYHGHQFDVYNPELGDGRGFLFAQMLDVNRDAGAARLLDLGTKGSGRTPWSRRGDGRLTLKGGVREILATEMLEARGVSTSKTFSLFETGEQLSRGDEPSPTRSSVLVRLSHSHLRFGTFQRLAYLEDSASLRRLFEYVVANYFPECTTPEALFDAVVRETADLCASWMIAGFVHGVLNSDNMNITGESFDYGPYRFLPHYDQRFIAAYFDHGGLYAYGRQPQAVFRNLVRLADAMSLLSPKGRLGQSLRQFEPHLASAVCERFLARLGVESVGSDDDAMLVGAAFDLLESTRVGFDQFFHDWFGGVASDRRARESPEREAYRGEAFAHFRRVLEKHPPTAGDRLDTHYFQNPLPTTLLIDDIEAIWKQIAEFDDWSALAAKVNDIRAMGDVLDRDPGQLQPT